jgi:hypothetical protein
MELFIENKIAIMMTRKIFQKESTMSVNVRINISTTLGSEDSDVKTVNIKMIGEVHHIREKVSRDTLENNYVDIRHRDIRFVRSSEPGSSSRYLHTFGRQLLGLEERVLYQCEAMLSFRSEDEGFKSSQIRSTRLNTNSVRKGEITNDT